MSIFFLIDEKFISKLLFLKKRLLMPLNVVFLPPNYLISLVYKRAYMIISI